MKELKKNSIAYIIKNKKIYIHIISFLHLQMYYMYSIYAPWIESVLSTINRFISAPGTAQHLLYMYFNTRDHTTHYFIYLFP